MNTAKIIKELEEIRAVSIMTAERATGLIKQLGDVSTSAKKSKTTSPEILKVLADQHNKMYNR